MANGNVLQRQRPVGRRERHNYAHDLSHVRAKSVLHVSPDTVSRFVMTKLALLTYNRAHSSKKIARSLYIDLERRMGLRTLIMSSMSNVFRKPK